MAAAEFPFRVWSEPSFESSCGALQLVATLAPAEFARISDEYADLLPANLRHAVVKRRVEFIAGRLAAAILLHRLGATNTDVGIGEGREPLWPQGYAGSISHSNQLVAIMVCRADSTESLGIDTETIDGMNTGSIEQLCLCNEEQHWLTHGSLSAQTVVILIFSAKEAFFKCLYPFVGRYFDFQDASVTRLDLAARSIELTLKVSLNERFFKGYCLSGKFSLSGSSVFTSFELPAQRRH